MLQTCQYPLCNRTDIGDSCYRHLSALYTHRTAINVSCCRHVNTLYAIEQTLVIHATDISVLFIHRSTIQVSFCRHVNTSYAIEQTLVFHTTDITIHARQTNHSPLEQNKCCHWTEPNTSPPIRHKHNIFQIAVAYSNLTTRITTQNTNYKLNTT